MPRFMQSILFLLGAGLLIVSAFLLIIRQQEPMQYFYVLAHEPTQPTNSMSFVLWRRDGQNVHFAPMPPIAGGYANAVVSPLGRWYVIQTPTRNGFRLYLGRLDSQYVIDLDSPPVIALNGSADPVFSPDGDWLLFSVAENSATRRLYIAPVTQRGDPYPLDAGVLSVDAEVFWMPDSAWIIYEIPNKNEIYRIHRSGGSPQLIGTGKLYSTQVFEGQWLLIEEEGWLSLLKSDGTERLSVTMNEDHQIEIFGTLHERRWLQLEAVHDSRFPMPDTRLRWQPLILIGLLFAAISLYPLYKRLQIARLA